jgi:hypothetical protein
MAERLAGRQMGAMSQMPKVGLPIHGKEDQIMNDKPHIIKPREGNSWNGWCVHYAEAQEPHGERARVERVQALHLKIITIHT